MKLIELHILQSFPVSCLNRDEVGSPKTAVFGGVTRARISSQCFKRAIRLAAKELERERDDKLFAGVRTLKAKADLADRLAQPKQEWNMQPLLKDKATEAAQLVCDGFLSSKKQPKEKPSKKSAKTDQPATTTDQTSATTSTLLYFSPGEIDLMAKAILEKRDAVDLVKVATTALIAPEAARARDLADIAIFGRMVSNAHDLTLEGAGLFNHPLTTHKADNDIDYWTAVDDRKAPGEDAGAANLNTAEFTSGVFYRYATLNLDLLFGEPRSGFPGGHLRHLIEPEIRQRLLQTFVRAALLSIPAARDNSHNSHVEVGYALGFYRAQGQPLQLVNAFESPVRAQGASGLLAPSVRAMLLHLQRLRDDYGDLVQPALELAFGSFRPVADAENFDGERLALIPKRAEKTDSKSALERFCEQLSEKAVAGFGAQPQTT